MGWDARFPTPAKQFSVIIPKRDARSRAAPGQHGRRSRKVRHNPVPARRAYRSHRLRTPTAVGGTQGLSCLQPVGLRSQECRSLRSFQPGTLPPIRTLQSHHLAPGPQSGGSGLRSCGNCRALHQCTPVVRFQLQRSDPGSRIGRSCRRPTARQTESP